MAGVIKAQVLPGWVRTVIIGRHPKWTIIRIATLIVVVALLYLFVLIPVRVSGISMEPNFRNNSINLIYRLAYNSKKPQRGDVVGVRWVGSRILLLKRIVALPGETIGFSDGHILINGKFLSEPYVINSCDWDMAPKALGADEYYIVGDNRSMPKENHTKGAYRLDNILGRVVFGGNGHPTLIGEE